jgi:pimeloyl-ACP methyl ester carboxylesterase
VLLHGVTDSSASWDAIAPSFVDDYRVMAVDLRGHGQSDKPATGYSWESDYAKDISAFITEQLDEPAIVVGHSLGAVVSAPVAVQAGKAVRAIVIEDPSAFIDDDHMRARFASKRPMNALPVDDWVEELMKTMKMSRDATEVRAEKLGNMSESVMTVAFEGGSIYNPEDLLSKVDCPTLVIIGNVSKGGVVDWTGHARLQRLLKGSKILERPDVGHGIHTEAPDRFIATVSDFLRGLS